MATLGTGLIGFCLLPDFLSACLYTSLVHNKGSVTDIRKPLMHKINDVHTSCEERQKSWVIMNHFSSCSCFLQVIVSDICSTNDMIFHLHDSCSETRLTSYQWFCEDEDEDEAEAETSQGW